MKHIFFITLFVSSLLVQTTFAQWKPAGNKIKTQWADELDPTNVLPEYPRPIMERSEWLNLNGLWDYAITAKNNREPRSYDGEILVPFAVESSLSGVQKTVGEKNALWYHRKFDIPQSWSNQKVLLHFGAVDWKTEVWINDIKIGEHVGGYSPFHFDISPYLNATGEQNMVVRVYDPTDKGPQARGKQVENPEGIWYTPVTGIWQTVWLEPVPESHITAVKSVPNIDENQVNIKALVANSQFGDVIQVDVYDEGQLVASSKASAKEQLNISIPGAKLWAPEHPFLYSTDIKLLRKGQVIDAAKSYFAMRKISMGRDENGIMRMELNNHAYFQFGPLDQGWWPDGLYTAPTDEALKYDIQKTKDFGFNMIRKHVKVEPARWYTHCDKLGILVWQDMPNGDASPQWQNRQYFNGIEKQRSSYSEQLYRDEWKAIIDNLNSHPCIAVWVPFNEAWGQFKTQEIAEWTKAYDPSRLVNPASGGNHYTVGDILDLHNYPGPEMYLFDAQRATVLGEYGGIGLALEGHLWAPDRNWGYVQFKSSKETTDEYFKYARGLVKLAKAGFAAAVYTQTTDVEVEVNGLMTYDRKVIKLDEKKVRKINQEVINSIH
ncbi:beta-galactosidase [Carboxylicivirga sp. A043]|uniref:glycoside hydrolase family 2 protein n=1 Tax=Carboxylicivirga litoralis TaxID=2816963 RepID=UPI0021CB8625|nr:sugar-binding domain-containing protein [Carboxylicivirga sp. A043]MCU4155643.1 beta-galactosidase [Carboxylicivirga sp. A043]